MRDLESHFVVKTFNCLLSYRNITMFRVSTIPYLYLSIVSLNDL